MGCGHAGRLASSRDPSLARCVRLVCSPAALSSPSLQSQLGRTALHRAAYNKASETVVELLLKENPDAAKATDIVRCPCAALAFAAPRRLPPARPGCLLPASALSATVRLHEGRGEERKGM